MDDKETLREDLKAIYRALPEQVKIAIFSPETTDAYDRVRERYLLTNEQREALSVQSGLLMMGLRLPQEFVAALMQELHLPRDKASLIAQELNRDIFNAIKNDLKEIHLPEQPTPVIPPPVAATPPAPTKPLYPSFLEQIKESTPPYISGAFPNASPQQKSDALPSVTPTPTASALNTPKAPSVPVASVQPVSVATTPTGAPLQAPRAPVAPLPPQTTPTTTPSVPVMPPQAITPPSVAPVLPITPATVTPPTKSLEEIQASIQNPTAPQATQAAFQGKAAEMDQSRSPSLGAPFTQREVILNPTRGVQPPPQVAAIPKPVEEILTQPTAPRVVAAPIVPPTPVQQVFAPAAQAPVQPVVTQPIPPPASIFEQKMSGVFVVKSDVPNYSAPIPNQSQPVPPPGGPTTFQMPQPMAPTPPTQAGDAYREPIT